MDKTATGRMIKLTSGVTLKDNYKALPKENS